MRIEDLLTQYTGLITDEEGTHTSGQLRSRVSVLRDQLQTARVCPGDNVVLMAANGSHFIVGLFGILAAGAVAVPLDPHLPLSNLVTILKDTGAAVCCYAGKDPTALITAHRPELTACQLIPLSGTAMPAPAPTSAPTRATVPASATLSKDSAGSAFILFSSGTTGSPKGIVLSHQAILQNIRAIAAYLQPTKEDCLCIVRPMVHSSTITGEILTAIYCNASMIAMQPGAPFSLLCRQLEEQQATILCIPPPLLYFFATASIDPQRLQSLQKMHISGAVINRRLCKQVHERFPQLKLYNGYGLTEAGPRVAQTSGSGAWLSGSVGKPVEGVAVEIRQPDGMTKCKEGTSGEVFVQSPSLMTGYWQNGRINPDAVQSGWLATNDLGWIDVNGELIITGRKDNMILTTAHNVIPEEVESVILQLEGINDCLVWGIADEIAGQRIVCAYVVAAAYALTAKDLRDWCRQYLAPWQIPTKFVQWPAVPVNSQGKKSRALSREKWLKEQSSPAPVLSVIMPMYNQPAALAVSLRFFQYQTLSPDQFEVIVIDDGSHEPVSGWLNVSSVPYTLRLFTTPNRGRAAARNYGARMATGVILVFCDADRIPARDFLQTHLAFHQERTGVAAFGCPWDCFLSAEKLQAATDADLPAIAKFSRASTYYKQVSSLFMNADSTSPVAWAAFLVGNASLRRKDLLQCGGFDEDFVSWGFEHFELALRLQQHGINICHHAAAASYHIPHPRAPGFFRQHIRDSMQLFKAKHPDINLNPLEYFLLGEISLQDFEQAFADHSFHKKITII